MSQSTSLTTFASLQNDTSATTDLNTNFAAVNTALGGCLSLTGQVPNQMQANLDMNSNRILNLPLPVSLKEPLRLADVGTLTSGGVINTINVNYPSVTVATAFPGVDPTGTTDSTIGLQNAFASAVASNSRLYLSTGTYKVNTTLFSLSSNMEVFGDGSGKTIITSTSTSTPILQCAGTNVKLHDLQLTRSVTPTPTGHGILCTGDMEESQIYNLEIKNQYVGAIFLSSSYGQIFNLFIHNCLSHGILFNNIATVNGGAVQWVLDTILSQSNGGSGIVLASVAGPSQVTLGSWRNIFTFSNTGSGILVLGVSGTPIVGFRLTNAFLGSDGSDELKLDTFGGLHQITNSYFELSTAGMGVNVTSNTTDVLIEGCISSGNNGNNYGLNASVMNHIVGCRGINSIAGFGVVIANGLNSVRTGNQFSGNFSGDSSFGTNSTLGSGAGNLPVALNNVAISGAALTAANDTNVTLTAGGSASTSLVNAASITAGWTGTLGVARGGTNLASGSSGGILGFTGTTTIASTPTLTANGLLIGGGAGVLPTTLSLGTSGQILQGNTGASPSFVNTVYGLAAQGQLLGTATNDNAGTGNIGEYVQSVVPVGSAVTLTTAVAANMTSIVLSAGDWDIDAVFNYTGGGTTTIAYLGAGISTTSATVDATNGRNLATFCNNAVVFNNTPGGVAGVCVPPLRFSLSTTTTIFAIAQSVFGTSTCTVFGILRARRVR